MAAHEQTIRPTATFLILLEGKDDRGIIGELLKSKGVNGDRYDITSADGNGNFTTKIGTLKKAENFKKIEKLIIITDADKSFDRAVARIRKALEDNNLPTPYTHGEFTSTSDGKTLSVGFFIMPGKQQIGMLEDLCLDYFKKADPDLWNCLESYHKCVEVKLKKPITNVSKAKALMMLAATSKSFNSLENAAQNDFFNFAAPAWQELVDFFISAGLIQQQL